MASLLCSVPARLSAHSIHSSDMHLPFQFIVPTECWPEQPAIVWTNSIFHKPSMVDYLTRDMAFSSIKTVVSEEVAMSVPPACGRQKRPLLQRYVLSNHLWMWPYLEEGVFAGIIKLGIVG
jgi:hypothetical protein